MEPALTSELVMLYEISNLWREMGCPDTFDEVPMKDIRSLPYSEKAFLDVQETLRRKHTNGFYVQVAGMNIPELLRLVGMYYTARYTFGASMVGRTSIELGANGMISVSAPMRVELNENGKEWRARRRALMEEIRTYAK
jgi:hypothetical protein